MLFGKPNQYFVVSEEKGALRVAWSREWMQYSLSVLIGGLVLSLSLSVIVVALRSPLSAVQWALLLSIQLMVVALLATLILMLLRKKEHFFDRTTDRFLRGKKLLSSIGNIHHLEIALKKSPRKDRRDMFYLSIAFKEAKPYQMYGQPTPARELFQLAATIAHYLHVEVIDTNHALQNRG